MLRKREIFQSLIIFGFLLIFVAAALAQDLGSSSDLFHGSNPKSKPEKKSAAKTAPPKKIVKPTAKRQTKTPVNSTRTAKTAPKNKTGKTSNKLNNTVITVAQTPDDPVKDEQFEEAVAEGNAARDARDYVAAEDAYKRAGKIKSDDARAIYGLGNIYSDQHRWEEAENLYRQAMKFEPDSADAYIALSFVLTQPLVGRDLSPRFAEAAQMARQAIELDPENPLAYDQLGLALELSGKIGSETETNYRRATKLDPTFALAYAHLGRLLRRSGKTSESADAYGKAIQFADDVPTMILVADVFQSQQRYGDSEQLLRRALGADPKNPNALYLLGRALTARLAYDEAEKILKKSVEVSPNSFVSYTLLGSLYSRQGDYNEAEKTLNEALKVISENEKKRLAQEYEIIGDGLVKKNKMKDAIRVYQQAVALDDDKSSLKEKLIKAKNISGN